MHFIIVDNYHKNLVKEMHERNHFSEIRSNYVDTIDFNRKHNPSIFPKYTVIQLLFTPHTKTIRLGLIHANFHNLVANLEKGKETKPDFPLIDSELRKNRAILISI